jgi:uncharacterized protein (DUF2236 family)
MATVTREELEAHLSKVQARVKDPAHGLYGPDSMLWKVNRENLLFVGGARGVLLQLAYPSVASGLAQHSKVKTDPYGRFQRTFDATFAMVFGDLPSALKAARMVHNIHTRVTGTDSTGKPYSANDVDALLWVHSTLWETSVLMYELFVGPLTLDEKERYYEETKLFAYLFGIPDTVLPRTWLDFVAYNELMWLRLNVTDEAREVGQVMFEPKPVPALKFLGSYYRSVTKAILPERVAKQYGLTPTFLDRVNLRLVQKSAHMALGKLPDELRYVAQYRDALKRIGT